MWQKYVITHLTEMFQQIILKFYKHKLYGTNVISQIVCFKCHFRHSKVYTN